MGGLNKLLFFYVKNSKFDFNKSKSVIRYCIAIVVCVVLRVTRVSVYRFLPINITSEASISFHCICILEVSYTSTYVHVQ